MQDAIAKRRQEGCTLRQVPSTSNAHTRVGRFCELAQLRFSCVSAAPTRRARHTLCVRIRANEGGVLIAL